MPLTRLRRRRVEGRKGLSGARHSHLTNAARNGDFTSPGTGIFSDWKWFVREEFGNGREIGKRSTGTYASVVFPLLQSRFILPYLTMCLKNRSSLV